MAGRARPAKLPGSHLGTRDRRDGTVAGGDPHIEYLHPTPEAIPTTENKQLFSGINGKINHEAYAKLPLKMIKQVCHLRRRAEGSVAAEGFA